MKKVACNHYKECNAAKSCPKAQPHVRCLECNCDTIAMKCCMMKYATVKCVDID